MLERAKLLHANGNYRMPNGSIEISDLRQKLQILIFSLFFTVASGFGLTGADSSVNRGNHLLCCRASAVPGCQALEGAAKEQRRAHRTLQERRPLRCCRFLPPRATRARPCAREVTAPSAPRDAAQTSLVQSSRAPSTRLCERGVS